MGGNDASENWGGDQRRIDRRHNEGLITASYERDEQGGRLERRTQAHTEQY